MLLIIIFNPYQTISDYVDDFIIHWNYMGSQVEI